VFADVCRGIAFVQDTKCSTVPELRHCSGGSVFVQYIGNIVISSETYFLSKGAWLYLFTSAVCSQIVKLGQMLVLQLGYCVLCVLSGKEDTRLWDSF